MSVHLAGRLAQRGDVALGDRCPIDRTLQLIGNRTALLLLREAFYGASRFDSLVKRVGLTEAVAAQRLRELVDAGILAKEPYRVTGQRTRHAYVLTEAGHDLLPAVLTLLEWGAAHTRGGAPTITHVGCGEPVQLEVRCAAGHTVNEEDVLVAPTVDARNPRRNGATDLHEIYFTEIRVADPWPTAAARSAAFTAMRARAAEREGRRPVRGRARSVRCATRPGLSRVRP